MGAGGSCRWRGSPSAWPHGAREVDTAWRATGPGRADANAFLDHPVGLVVPAGHGPGVRLDVANFARFLSEGACRWPRWALMDVFAWVDQACGRRAAARGRCAWHDRERRRRRSTGAWPPSAFFEHLMISGVVPANPVPAPRRGQGLRPTARGMLGHLGPGRARGGGRLVREQRRPPESLELGRRPLFLASLATHRDRAMVLAMLLGGCARPRVRGLLLKDVDQGRRRCVRVIGKGGWNAGAGRRGVLRRNRRLPAPRETARLAPRSASWCCAARALAPPVTEADCGPLFRRHRAALGAVG